MRRVGQRDEFLVESLLRSGLLGRKVLAFSFQFSTFRFLGLRLILLALLHQCTNLLGYTVCLSLHSVGLHLQRAALLIETYNLGNALFNVLYILDFQSRDTFLTMILDILQL